MKALVIVGSLAVALAALWFADLLPGAGGGTGSGPAKEDLLGTWRLDVPAIAALPADTEFQQRWKRRVPKDFAGLMLRMDAEASQVAMERGSFASAYQCESSAPNLLVVSWESPGFLGRAVCFELAGDGRALLQTMDGPVPIVRERRPD